MRHCPHGGYLHLHNSPCGVYAMSDITALASVTSHANQSDGTSDNKRKRSSLSGKASRTKPKAHIVLTFTFRESRRNEIERLIAKRIKRIPYSHIQNTGNERPTLSRDKLFASEQKTAKQVTQYYRIPLSALCDSVTVDAVRSYFAYDVPDAIAHINAYHGQSIYYGWQGAGAGTLSAKTSSASRTREIYRQNKPIFDAWDKVGNLEKQYQAFVILQSFNGQNVSPNMQVPFPVMVQGIPVYSYTDDKGNVIPYTATIAQLQEINAGKESVSRKILTDKLRSAINTRKKFVVAYNNGDIDTLQSLGISFEVSREVSDNVFERIISMRVNYVLRNIDSVIDSIKRIVLPASRMELSRMPNGELASPDSSNTIVDVDGHVLVTTYHRDKPIASGPHVPAWEPRLGEALIGYNRVCPYPIASSPVLREDLTDAKWEGLAHTDFIPDIACYI